MSFERQPSGKFGYNPPKEIMIPESSIIEADDDLLPLCAMCTKSRLNCENIYIRQVEVEVEPGDPGEVVGLVRQKDGTYIKQGLGFKFADGVAEGIYNDEEDIPIPVVCEWFNPKPPG